MHALVDASSVQECPTLGPVDLSSDIPPVLHLVANSGTKLDLVDLSSDVPTGSSISWPRVVLS